MTVDFPDDGAVAWHESDKLVFGGECFGFGLLCEQFGHRCASFGQVEQLEGMARRLMRSSAEWSAKLAAISNVVSPKERRKI